MVFVSLSLSALAQPATPPRLIDGKPVHARAVVDGRVIVALSTADGQWRNEDDFTVLDRTALISDLKAKPRATDRDWVQPIKADYRGTEGWENLRWGMTLPEVKRALGRVLYQPTQPGIPLSFRVGSGKTSILVQCVFADDRLALIGVKQEFVGFDAANAQLVEKYGVPFAKHGMRRAWETAETRLALVEDERQDVRVVYVSKAFDSLMSAAMAN